MKSIIISNSLLYATYITIKKYENVKSLMPILLVSGYDDSLGDYGKGIKIGNY